jgi:hypothetical protein
MVRSLEPVMGRARFSWSRDAKGWLECAEKVSAMIKVDDVGQRRVTGDAQELSRGYNDVSIEGRQHERPPAAVAPSMGPIPVT